MARRTVVPVMDQYCSRGNGSVTTTIGFVMDVSGSVTITIGVVVDVNGSVLTTIGVVMAVSGSYHNHWYCNGRQW